MLLISLWTAYNYYKCSGAKKKKKRFEGFSWDKKTARGVCVFYLF